MIYSIVNQKGGVGKTTTTINLGAYLALANKKVLLVDLDPQANATSGVGLQTDKIVLTIYHALSGQINVVEAIHPTTIDRLHLLPAIPDLAAIELELAQEEDKSQYLKQLLDPLRSAYDYILIDCPPALGVLTLNALTASDKVIIPLQCEYFALEGLTRLLNTLQRVQVTLNPRLKMDGILLTMFDSRTSLSSDVEKEARHHFKEKIFDVSIPRNVRLSEAPSHGLPILYYAPQSKGAVAYQAFAEEVLTHD